MNDISKCKNEQCTSKYACHRYTSIAGMMQSYLTTNGKMQKCKMFWNNNVKIELIKNVINTHIEEKNVINTKR